MEDWLKDIEGKNLKFKREALLNYAMNRWGLNKSSSVDKVSELIRKCAPKNFEAWEQFYFKNATQRKKNGLKITKEYLRELGKKLYIKLTEVVQSELEAITEEECIQYVYNLVINRMYEGYITEINTIYGQLENLLNIKIDPAPDEWDRLYNVDFCIKIKEKFIGIQIKPISFSNTFEDYKWREVHKITHNKFEKEMGGKVFTVFSVKKASKKIIDNLAIIEEIEKEIKNLENSV